MEIIELKDEKRAGTPWEYKILMREHEKLLLICDGLIGANNRDMALAMAEVMGVIEMISTLLMEAIDE